MSLTDDTNLQTIDIPLPDESIPNSGSSGESSGTNSWTQSPSNLKNNQNVVNTHIVDQTSANSTTYVNQYANPYAANAVHPYYYPFYPSYQQMPQMMAQNYPYFMPPIIRPILPIVPQLTSMAAQKTTTANKSNNSKDPNDYYEDDDEEEEDSDSDPTVARKPSTKASNILPIHCTETMGLNPLIYQNIQSSPYFKNNLFQLKTYHEVIDEIFYSVKHLEPWEKGSRKVGGQTGMCGSVRGVGAGGIISTPFCILYKLFTLKLTRKQVNGLIRHKDSPFIRALGFMYVRFTQPPQHLYNWFEPFLEDEEELDPKAGGGAPMTVGQMCRHMLTKLDWFSTLFPRVPVPIQKQIEKQLKQRDEEYEQQMREERGIEDGEVEEEEGEQEEVEQEETPIRRGRDSSRDGYHKRSDRRHEREKKRSRERERRSRSRDDKSSRSDDRHRRRSRSPNSPHSHRHRGGDYRSDRSERNEHRHRRR